MDIYAQALKWADERGDSGGALRMRKALLSLYNSHWYLFSIAEALNALDETGQRLLLSCVTHYAQRGETPELRVVGEAIESSRYLDGWRELLTAAHEAQSTVRRRWEWERERQQA